MGMNQLSSDEYGSWTLGPEVRVNLWCSNVPVLGFHLYPFLRFGVSAAKTSPGNQGITPARRETQCTMSTITVEYVYVIHPTCIISFPNTLLAEKH